MSQDTPSHGFATRALHVGQGPDPSTGARQVPIHQTTSFVFKDHEHAANLFALKEVGYIYSRLTNPTVGALQERLASLEGGVGAVCTASGHSAMLMTLFTLLSPGKNFVAARQLYGGSLNQFANSFPRGFGWESRFVEMDDLEAMKAAIDDDTRAIVIESLANPGGNVSDIRAIADIANAAGVPLIVDNTMASPAVCRPIEHGATLVIHSTTKFISGNGSSVGGVVVDSGTFDWSATPGKYPALSAPEPGYHGLVFHEALGPMAFTFYAIAVGLRDLGPSMAPMNAYITLLGAETLPLRMEKHGENAQKVAAFLEAHPAVDYVQYAGLASNKHHDRVATYLGGNGGCVFTFGLKGGYDAGIALVNAVKLFSHVANIGDTRSLIIHPASTTHSQLSDAEKVTAGAGPEVVRLSIGLEDVADIIADLDQALVAASGAAPVAAE